tara:strand:+ start:3631 stop:4041 length:411 start_codon:yes stop_codon:yes gene_type:complete
MIETRSKNAINNGEIELIKEKHNAEIQKLNDELVEIKSSANRQNVRGVLIFIYTLSLLATFSWKYLSVKDVLPLLKATNTDRLILSINPNLASYNLLDLSIGVTAYHYFIFQMIRYRSYVTCATLFITIGSAPFLM